MLVLYKHIRDHNKRATELEIIIIILEDQIGYENKIN